MADLDGAGGAKTLVIDLGPGVPITVTNFGSFGTGGAPSDPGELDTLHFIGHGVTAADMKMVQDGADVVVTFDADPNATPTTIKNTSIEQLGNVAGLGNFRFGDEPAPTDSLDIWGAAETGDRVHHAGTVTFLNELDNDVRGFDEGNDVINSLAGDDTLNGFAGNDILRGGHGDDHLIGGLGNDGLYGELGDDTLAGGRGDDLLDGGAGDDLMTGGKGNDVYVVDSLGDTIVEDIQNSRGGGWADEVRSAISFSLAPYERIENLTLTGSADIDASGNHRDNVLTGNAGDNILTGGGGNDLLRGGFAGGADSFLGGGGDDVVFLDDSNDFVAVDGGTGIDRIIAYLLGPDIDLTGESGDRIANIEILDLSGPDTNKVTLDAAAVAHIAGASAFGPNTLLIKGDAGGDVVRLSDPGWVKGGEVTDPFGQPGTYASWTNGSATALIETGLGVMAAAVPGEGATIVGAAPGDAAGTAVSSAGDINNDGFDDVIVGARLADSAGGADAGISYVVYGKEGGIGDIDLATLTASEGFKISGAAAGDQSGLSVSLAGDLNGDGIADLIIGAPFADPSGESKAGNAYVIYGKEGGPGDLDLAALSATQGAIIAGAAANDFSGRSVKSAGDVNGDGIDDVVIGAPGTVSAAGGETGTAYVVYGKVGGIGDLDLDTLSPAQGFRITGENSYDYAARSVSGAGDVNGDGFDDVIVGANAGVPGESFVVFGKDGGPGDVDLATLSPEQGFRISGFGDYEGSGHNVASAGDVNGDGFADLVIGSAEAHGPNGRYSGTSFVVYGKAGGPGDIDLETLSPAQGFKIFGAAEYDQSGDAVSSAGDVNGDGIDDLLIGAASANPDGLQQAGEAYLIFGKAGGSSDIDLAVLTLDVGFKIAGAIEGDLTGASVGAAGDVNGDGFADLIVGSPQAFIGGPGQARIIYGGDFTASVTKLGTSGDDVLTGGGGDVFVGGLGNDVLGDDSSDGFNAFHGGAGDDVILIGTNILGDPIRVDGGSGIDTLRASQFGGSIDLTGNLRDRVQSIEVIDLEGPFSSHTLTLDRSNVAHISGSNGSAFGPNTVLIKGDGGFDGDVVTLTDSGWAIDGKITDPFGQTGTYTRWINGEATALIESEITVLAIGDIDLGDLSPSEGFTVTGAASGDHAGVAVSTVGDINNDGIDDFIVGANGADPASGIDAGQSYVIFGKAGGLPDIDLASLTASQGFKISGAAAGDGAGNSLSDAGDVNGDGIADLIVGAVGADPLGRPGAGETYVIYGKTGGPGDIDLATLTTAQGFAIAGVTDYSHSAHAVRSAGDVNGDGIDDIILSAPSSLYQNGTAEAEAYVIYGKAGGLGDIDLSTLTSAQGFRLVNDPTTHSVSGIGDINGDGFDDVAVGAGAGSPGYGYVIFGRAGIPAAVDLRSLSGADGFQITPFDMLTESSGLVVSAAGDINGDGFEDLAVADAEQGPYSGRTAVVYGKAGGPGDIDLSVLAPDQGFSIVGVAPYDASGRSISSAGDVNGDGVDDLLIGAPDADPGGREDAGEAYLIFGKAGGLGDINLATLTPDAGLKISGAGEDDATGSSVRAAGDINGDGYADIVIGAPHFSAITSESGQAHVIYGRDFTGSVTHSGTDGNDAIAGTAADDSFVGGLDNDTLTGGGGVDSFQGGAGDDAIHVGDGSFRKVDGGNGADTLHLDFGDLVDLGNIDGDAVTADQAKIQNVETIDTDNGTSNQITLRLADVLHIDADDHAVGGVAGLDNVLKLDGDGSDTLSLDPADGWSAPDTATLAGYAIYAAGNVKIAVDLDITVAVA